MGAQGLSPPYVSMTTNGSLWLISCGIRVGTGVDVKVSVGGKVGVLVGQGVRVGNRVSTRKGVLVGEAGATLAAGCVAVGAAGVTGALLQPATKDMINPRRRTLLMKDILLSTNEQASFGFYLEIPATADLGFKPCLDFLP